ncbi:unnamed protein product [Lactuca virosa]|uniref:F-box domain-containing protein n=1 Tax=Lactuca virosa TaxID=75947 RepID=A0AAU9LCZ3_9ASTR|nr:unnamed protein product [Lactuca virosa]
MGKHSWKSREGVEADNSCITTLPDGIILQILNKSIDLKTLCFCYLVSKRFSSIVLQVDAISFTAPCIDPNIPHKNTEGDVAPSMPLLPIISLIMGNYFPSVLVFLSKFKRVKSLFFEIPSSGEIGMDNCCLFKWKVKFGNRFESFMFLWPNSISDKDGLYITGNENDEKKFDISFQCLKDVMYRHSIFLYFIDNLPTLEYVSITDSGRRGRLSLSGKKLIEVKESLHSASETELNRVEVPAKVSKCCIPVLKLPVSGYVMNGVFVILMEMKDVNGGIDGLMNSEDGGFEDKEEAALYTEAVKEILEKHKGMMQRLI